MPIDNLGLSLAYWLHMIATVAWIGGLVALSLYVIPAARRTLDQETYIHFLGNVQGKLQRIGWFSLAVLVGTGLFQLSAHPSYEGFLAINTPWAVAIFAKHMVIGGMVLTSAYITWVVNPRLQRLALMQAAGKAISVDQTAELRRREAAALRVNLWLSVVVLLLTALARAA